ncbi:MAG: transglycosylase SLT domain-containing protein [Cyanobacteria bacterium RI_101]|nr:transglycosylase SLT domain-containing protein [Cyanobacteria bacterium RI_101]
MSQDRPDLLNAKTSESPAPLQPSLPTLPQLTTPPVTVAEDFLSPPAPEESEESEPKPRRRSWPRWFLVVALALGGGALLTPLAWQGWTQWQTQEQHRRYEAEQNQPSAVLKLVNTPAKERAERLKAIADQTQPSLERSRARYLLATDLLKQFEGGPAVRWLENLEVDYPTMAPYILLKRGRGYELSNENIRAKETWEELIQKYPDSAAAAEALNLLGKTESQYWEQALAKHPQHPRALDILHQKLERDPESSELMGQILVKAPTDPRSAPLREKLLANPPANFTPEVWTAIGDGFWNANEFPQAAQAYAQAPTNPQNLYRLARSQQLAQLKPEAMANYRKLIETYPKTEETALALKRLAALVPPAEAVGYLDQIVARFPVQAPEALAQKAKLLERSDPSGATAARQTLLEKYSDSEEAAQLRWRRASQAAKAGKVTEAWKWAEEIANQNPNSDPAPKAIFWIGKWAQQLNRLEDAAAAFKNVIARYPQSYYAWRSAVLLGWPVGDFNSVRALNPPVTLPPERPVPPAGSDLFKELYRLGQDPEARAVFAAETGAQEELTVEQKFTEALLKLQAGEYLQGINQVLNLRNTSDPKQKQAWQALRQTPEYWQALFPFPYQELIFEWSKKRNLNPFLVTALIRQESRFEKEIRSPVGATGLMQVMPSTAEWIAPQIDLKDYSLTDPEDNVNMGTWYFDHTHETYKNNSALAVASYNAGPGNVSKWLSRFEGQDPDWFVEQIPFAETKGYVESVFGNYWNYLRVYDPDIAPLLQKLKP